MNAAFDEGTATLLSAAVAWLVRHRGVWWVVYEHGWLRITDAATAQDLDQAAARLTQAAATDGHAGKGLCGLPRGLLSLVPTIHEDVHMGYLRLPRLIHA
jgi:hypothetical protein